ncbi:antiterminator LoaP [Paenibacillus bouchesdurhonensis]|uniref:antiterminator LoaP n=1 Tax=Paenibacillus bouchesdurhonensis TaxID=1870990 RepID=UPI000DA60DC8|nr:antiterminator LoaP [Paenibacillus bouchesdurhonensis]
MGWYVLFVRNGYEDHVQKSLEKISDNNIARCIVPTRKIPERKKGQIKDVEKIMFPGYVFIQTQMTKSIYYTLSSHPLIYSLLNYRNRKDLNYNQRNSDTTIQDSDDFCFKQVPKEEIEQILQLLDDHGKVDYSKVHLLDSRIKVISGPLKGKEGIIKKIDKRKNRAKVNINLMGCHRMIDLGIEVLSYKN